MIPAPRRRRRSAPSTASRRPWRTPVLALSLLINLTAVGYRLTEGWDWGDCYWMVVVTLSTMGWSDGTTQPLSTAGRVVTTLAIVGGLVVVQVTIQSLLGLSESGYFRRLRERRFKNWLSMMENHVILCGYGRIGREIADQLVSEGVPLVVVEMDTAQKEAAEERGCPCSRPMPPWTKPWWRPAFITAAAWWPPCRTTPPICMWCSAPAASPPLPPDRAL